MDGRYIGRVTARTLGAVLFTALLAGCLAVSRAQEPTHGPVAGRIVAIGDLHGDLAATRKALLLAGVMDEQDRWVGGDAVLVQTGDQLDRGNDEPQILALLDRLQVEAAAEGGAVHVLNGNHEILNAQGKLRYVSEEGFADFAVLPGVDLDTPELAELPEAERGRRAAFAPGGPYARLLARRNVVVIIGDTLFVHGGVLPHVAAYGIDRLNTETRAWLNGEAAEPPEILTSRGGPLWARDYSLDPDRQDCKRLDEALRMTGTRRMVVGHTVQDDGITAKCGELVWCIDVGMSAHYGGTPEVLEIIGDTVRVIHPTLQE